MGIKSIQEILGNGPSEQINTMVHDAIKTFKENATINAGERSIPMDKCIAYFTGKKGNVIPDISAIVSAADTTMKNDKTIDEAEFTAIHVLLEMFEAFKSFDVNNDGSLGLPEFPKVYLDLTAAPGKPAPEPLAPGTEIFKLEVKTKNPDKKNRSDTPHIYTAESWSVLTNGTIQAPDCDKFTDFQSVSCSKYDPKFCTVKFHVKKANRSFSIRNRGSQTAKGAEGPRQQLVNFLECIKTRSQVGRTKADSINTVVEILKGLPKRRRMAQREFSDRRDSPVMVRLLEEIVAAQDD